MKKKLWELLANVNIALSSTNKQKFVVCCNFQDNGMLYLF